MKTIITNPTCVMLTPFVECNTGLSPVQGLGFASKTGTTLKGRSIKAPQTHFLFKKKLSPVMMSLLVL